MGDGLGDGSVGTGSRGALGAVGVIGGGVFGTNGTVGVMVTGAIAAFSRSGSGSSMRKDPQMPLKGL